MISTNSNTEIVYLLLKVIFVLLIALLILLSILVGTVANVLVIIVIASDKQLRKCPMYLLLANMALADVSLLTTVAAGAFFKNESTHDISYIARGYLQRVSLLVSMYTSVAVCLERFYLVAYPLQFKSLFRPRRVCLFVFYLWLFFAVYSVPSIRFPLCPAVLRNETYVLSDDYIACRVRLTQSPWWLAYDIVDLLTVPVPAVLLICFYSKTCRILWSADVTSFAGARRPAGKVEVDPNLVARRKSVKMLIICAVIFCTCYLLSWIAGLTERIFKKGEYFPFMIIAYAVLMIVSSAINPFVYAFYSQRLRAKLLNVLCCCCVRKPVE